MGWVLRDESGQEHGYFETEAEAEDAEERAAELYGAVFYIEEEE